MRRLTRHAFGRTFVVGTFVFLGASLMGMGLLSIRTAAADPPADQTYTGNKACASCHFKQYMAWNKTGHAKAFDLLTAKYENDAKCLKCHTTGYGEPTGFKDKKTSAALMGVGCENCHGPGSAHEATAQKYAKVKTLSPEQDKEVRGTIWLTLPKNVCIECHMVQAHKENPTPPEMRTKK